MARNIYPLTTLRPLQHLDFLLENGQSVRIVLMPQPDTSGRHIAHVDMDYAAPGSTDFTAIGHEGQRRSVLQAAQLAWQIALGQAHKAGAARITAIRLQGEEFLEKTDMELLAGAQIPVTLY